MDDLLERHAAFWRLEEPSLLRSVAAEKGWRRRPYPLSGGRRAVDPVRIEPRDLDLEEAVGETDALPPGSDLIRWFGYRYPAAWMEGIIGCPVHASAYGCVSRPALPSGEPVRFDPQRALDSPWREALRAATLRGVSLGRQRGMPPCQPHLRGVADMAAAYLGEERFCLLVMDDPQALRRLAAGFADLWIGIAGETLRLRSDWRGGAVSLWRLWAPGRLVDYQIDASSLLSPAQYREIFLPLDREILSAFPFSVVHLHSVGLHVLDQMLSTAVRAVQINADREAAPWRKELMFRACRAVQEAGKSLLYSGELSGREEEEMTALLAPRGVALELWRKSLLPG